MSWYTYCKADFDFIRKTYNTKGEVVDDIESLKKERDHLEKVLIDLSYSKDVADNDEDLFTKSNNRVAAIEETIDALVDCSIEIFRLNVLIENWFTRHGDFVKHDGYYKCIKELPHFFTKDKVYGINKLQTNEQTTKFIIDDHYEAIVLTDDMINNMFIESTEDEFNKF